MKARSQDFAQESGGSGVVTRGGSSGPFFFWGGAVLAEGPNLPPFTSFSTDLGHFILNLLNFDIYFFIFC